MKKYRQNAKRYVVTKSGYVFDRHLFRYFILYMALICAVVLFRGGNLFENAYVSCPADAIGGICENPMYGMCEQPACKVEWLYPGESIGTDTSEVVEEGILFIVLGLIMVLWLNHLINNKEEKK